MQPQWYILLTEPQREAKAVKGLVSRGYEAYGPTYWKKFIRRHRKVEEQRPLFPCYIFVRLRLGVDRLIPSLVPGVVDYFLWDVDGSSVRVPYCLPDGLVQAIKEREGLEEMKFRSPRAPFNIGESVRVIDGPFTSFVAQVFSLDDKWRVNALVDIFGRKTKVEFEAEQLEKV